MTNYERITQNEKTLAEFIEDVTYECDMCHGSGEVPMTNEEWFCSLDIEDKAREISDMTAQGYWSEELVEKWLKEKHE